MAAKKSDDQMVVSFDRSVAILQMKRGENRLNNEFLQQFLDALQKIERNSNIKVLVTIGEGKFYSNGLDLNSLATYGAEDLKLFDELYQKIHKTLLTFPIITIAAINGHAYAAGGILALAHDIRIMKQERGWFCLPEIKINRSFTISTMEIVKAKLPKAQFTDSILMGRKYTGPEAKDAGIVDEVVPGERLLATAVDKGMIIAGDNFDRNTLSELKNALYFPAIKALTEPNQYHSKL